jgi:hypothetical protein
MNVLLRINKMNDKMNGNKPLNFGLLRYCCQSMMTYDWLRLFILKSANLLTILRKVADRVVVDG